MAINISVYLQCTPSGFASDPRMGHLPNCEPLSYDDVMKDNEIIGKEEAEKSIFEKKPVDDSLRNTTLDEPPEEFSDGSTNCNGQAFIRFP